MKFTGGMYLPSSDSGRLIVGTWWLGVLVVVTTYCGEFILLLQLLKASTHDIHDLQEIWWHF